MALKSRPVSLQLNCMKTSSFFLTLVGPLTTRAFCQRGWRDSSSKEEEQYASSERQKNRRSKGRQKKKKEKKKKLQTLFPASQSCTVTPVFQWLTCVLLLNGPTYITSLMWQSISWGWPGFTRGGM